MSDPYPPGHDPEPVGPAEARQMDAAGPAAELDADLDADLEETSWLDQGAEEGDLGEESYLPADTNAQWEGDKGSLSRRQRDTLVALLKKAFISSEDSTDWRTLTRDPAPIEVALNNLYMALVVDARNEVAYAVPARSSDNAFRTLVRDAPNSREETLVLVHLRSRFRIATADGDPFAYTDVDTVQAYVARFRPASATDHVTDEGRVRRAIDSAVTAGLLVRTDDATRYRIHRAIEAVLPQPKLEQLLEGFRALRDQADTQADPRFDHHADADHDDHAAEHEPAEPGDSTDENDPADPATPTDAAEERS